MRRLRMGEMIGLLLPAYRDFTGILHGQPVPLLRRMTLIDTTLHASHDRSGWTEFSV